MYAKFSFTSLFFSVVGGGSSGYGGGGGGYGGGGGGGYGGGGGKFNLQTRPYTPLW